jgi:CBS domain-containing protein
MLVQLNIHSPKSRKYVRTFSVFRLLSEEIRDVTSLRVKDLMAKDLIMVDSSRTVRETAITMDRSGHGCLLVTSMGKIVGIVTERDLVRRALTRSGAMGRIKVKSIMSSPLIAVDPMASVEEAAKLMAHHKVRRLPVVGTNGLTGLITVSDIAKYMSERSLNSPIFHAIARSGNEARMYA